jgi:hypothetical protein
MDVEANQFRRQIWQSLISPLGVSALYGGVLALDVPELPQPLHKLALQSLLIDASKNPDSPILSDLLRLGGERRGEEATTEDREERTSIQQCDQGSRGWRV